MIEYKKGIIYFLYGENKNDVLYIGSTFNLFERFNSHCVYMKKGEEPIYRHLRENKLGVNILTLEEHPDISVGELKRCEKYWIDQFRQWGFNIKNIIDNISYVKKKQSQPKHIIGISEEELQSIIDEGDYFNFAYIMDAANVTKISLYRMIKDGKVRTKPLGTFRKLYSLTDVINNKPRKNANK